MEIKIGDISVLPYPNNTSYVVSETGEIYSLNNKKWLHLSNRGNGYLMVSIRVNGVMKSLSVHRVVAQTYILNPENKQCVNHKDGNKENNAVYNLEWCTYIENSNHALDAGLLDNNFIAVGLSNKKRWQDGRNEKLRKINRNRTKERWEDGTLRAAISLSNRKVIDICTQIIYADTNEAAIENNINKSTLRVKLTGHRYNNTNLRYL